MNEVPSAYPGMPVSQSRREMNILLLNGLDPVVHDFGEAPENLSTQAPSPGGYVAMHQFLENLHIGYE